MTIFGKELFSRLTVCSLCNLSFLSLVFPILVLGTDDTLSIEQSFIIALLLLNIVREIPSV